MIVARLAAARDAAALWMLLPLAMLALPLWDWPVPDWPALIAAVGAFVAAFWLGATAALQWLRARGARLEAELPPYPAVPVGWAAVAMLAAALGINLVSLAGRIAFNPLDCGVNILACTNEAYQGYVEGTQSGAAVEYLRILTAPIVYGALGLAIWNLATQPRRRLWPWYVAVVGSEVLLALGTGTSRNLANVILFALFARWFARPFAPPRRTRSLRATLALGFGGALFIVYFAATQLARTGAVALTGLLPFGGGYIEALSYQLESDSFVLKGAESLARYVCSGYFAMSLSLNHEAGLTFPFGHSLVLARRAALATGDASYIDLSLPGQLESTYGWSRLQQWDSLFPWLMSDFGYVGTAVWMAAFGVMFVLGLAVALTRRDALSRLPAFLMFLLVLYVPANNQLAQTPETISAFVVMVALLAARAAGWAGWGRAAQAAARRA